ncbi:MAG TPA: DsbA family protein [Candidatus Acidoferrales bacterium]|nr:DsbA family protein [Candidatus Acidoferrales bacterium]
MRAKMFFLLALSAIGGLQSFDVVAQMADQTPRTEAIAIIEGEPVYEGELAAPAQGQLRQLAFRQYEQKRKILEQLLEQKLLEIEAKKRGDSVETLLREDVDKSVSDPTAAELRAYYLGLRDKLGRPFDEAKSELPAMLKQAAVQEARQNYFKMLRERNKMTILIRPPRIDVAVDVERLRGDPSAPVSIVEFSDFQCPYCQKSEAVLRELLVKYKGKVNLSYRDFPLRDVHPQAQLAAEASRCAREQGKYWEYHDLLFENPGNLERASLHENARELKLDVQGFDSCLNRGQYKPQIERDVQDGLRAGVTATPGFFINGVFLGGAQPLVEFEAIIDAELAALGQQHVHGADPRSPE